jgi:hypothetical protein
VVDSRRKQCIFNRIVFIIFMLQVHKNVDISIVGKKRPPWSGNFRCVFELGRMICCDYSLFPTAVSQRWARDYDMGIHGCKDSEIWGRNCISMWLASGAAPSTTITVLQPHHRTS